MTETIIVEATGERLARALMDVATGRWTLAQMKAGLDERRRVFDIVNEDRILDIKAATEAVTASEQMARDLALAVYADTGSKQPHPGVGIRVTTRLVYDRHDALQWAQDHNLALTLDVKAFEGIAKHGAVDGIVTFQVEPQATISSDLVKVLEG